MTNSLAISALRIADEAFLVASTIERCPKTMMLRELVMNALEAAAAAPEGARTVRIGATKIDGTDKLTLWNTGPGMTAEQLRQVSDLASSLHKEHGLDRNFGMGAKVASLPSNKHGLRYRSCHAGVVSQITLGQRNGVYGRIIPADATPGESQDSQDVTDICRAEGQYDLSTDWTEVVLFGNRADQNTVLDPYNGNPASSPTWVGHYLTQRFYRMPPATSLTLSADVCPQQGTGEFHSPSQRQASLTRVESVRVQGGLVIHYGYNAPGSHPDDAALGRISGSAGIVYQDEIYGLRSAQTWLLDAPLYGMPFGARYYTVFVELPDTFGVQPEVYRQFLRFQDGDQRQVTLGDFAALVRTNIPAWLRDIIASYGPSQADYMQEVRGELQDLLVALGISARAPKAILPRGLTKPADSNPPLPRPPRPPSPPKFEKPPEIITLRDDALIEERSLAGRVAKYYPDSHQLFINAKYPAIAWMAAHLRQDFEGAADPELTKTAANDLAEWAITRKVARALIYTLGKKTTGWAPEDINRAQSPESLSLAADDYSLLIDSARRRLAATLDVDLYPASQSVPGTAPMSWENQTATELDIAEQEAQRALEKSQTDAAPFLLRVSEIEARRRNLPAAVEWANKAIAADPNRFSLYNHLAGLLLQQSDLDGADRVARQAAGLQSDSPAAAYRLRSTIAIHRRNLPEALQFAQQAVTAEPENPNFHSHLATVFQQSGALDDARKSTQTARDLETGNPARFLRQLSAIALQARDLADALEFAQQAVAADPHDVASYMQLAQTLQRQGNLDRAEQTVRSALEIGGTNPGRLLLLLSNLSLQRNQLPTAIHFARQAAAADPKDTVIQSHLAAVLQKQGDFAEAQAVLEQTMQDSQHRPARLLSQLSALANRQKDHARAAELAHEAIAASPHDPVPYSQLAGVLAQQSDYDGAVAAVQKAITLSQPNSARFIQQLSGLEASRNNLPEAIRLAEQAVLKDPKNQSFREHLGSLFTRADDLDAAEATCKTALSMSPENPARLLHQLSNIARRRHDLPNAIAYAQLAVEAAPMDPWMHNSLSGVLLQAQDLDGAALAANQALLLAPNSVESLNNLAKIEERRRSLQRQTIEGQSVPMPRAG